jgi:CheY-like chemotaxis protein
MYPDLLPPDCRTECQRSFEGDKEKYIASGLDEYLTKPLDMNAFIELMQKLNLY